MENAKSFDDFVGEEDRIHKIFFLPWYKEKSIQVIEDNVGKNATYDVKINWGGKIWTIDEKATERNYFCAELIQDVETGNLGHIYHPKDYYLYSVWQNRKIDMKPLALYLIKAEQIPYFVVKYVDSCNIYKNENGWGKTLFIPIDFEKLIKDGFAYKLL